jgi:dephospho-CoA kinase
MVLGITGGFGCGKSTVARLLGERGFRCLDSDVLVREKVLPSAAVHAALRARYGETVFSQDGSVNRSALGERAFSDDTERAWLEDLTHPMVFALWRSAIRDAAPGAGPGNGGVRWALEVPLLFEKGLENWFDYIVCVACSPEQQFARLEQRGWNRALAGQRISKQLPLARKMELSDFVLWNEGSPEFLKAQVDRLVNSVAA